MSFSRLDHCMNLLNNLFQILDAFGWFFGFTYYTLEFRYIIVVFLFCLSFALPTIQCFFVEAKLLGSFVFGAYRMAVSVVDTTCWLECLCENHLNSLHHILSIFQKLPSKKFTSSIDINQPFMMSPCSQFFLVAAEIRPSRWQFPKELRPGDFVPKKHLRLGYLSSVVVVVVVVVEVLLLRFLLLVVLL